MSKINEYDVPKEITDLFVESTAMGSLRDIYVKRPFGFKKARKCSIRKEVVERKAWRMFADLYPKAPPLSLQYQHHINKVVVIEPEQDKA